MAQQNQIAVNLHTLADCASELPVLSSNTHSFTTNATAAANLHSEMHHHFSHIELALIELNERLNKTEQTVGKIKLRVDQINARLTQVEMDLREQETQTEQNDIRLKGASYLFEQMRDTLERHGQEIETLQGACDNCN